MISSELRQLGSQKHLPPLADLVLLDFLCFVMAVTIAGEVTGNRLTGLIKYYKVKIVVKSQQNPHLECVLLLGCNSCLQKSVFTAAYSISFESSGHPG